MTGWQKVAVVFIMTMFAGFVLYMTASNPDWSEFRSTILLAIGYTMREFLPKFLSSISEVINKSQGGE